jgi:TPR repeat protein
LEGIGLRSGLPKDEREAARLYKLAADEGNASARAYLGDFYEFARGGLAKDVGEAARSTAM